MRRRADTLAAVSALGLDLSIHAPHALHRGDVAWLETNCYVDLLIEVIHALGHEPLAALGSTIRTDLEADQFTFFKIPHTELEDLYGIEIIELNPWTSVLEQVYAEVAARRIPLIEVDSWFLPDTAATAYRTAHVKTTIGIEALDAAARRMRYFHNAGFFELDGDDFDGIFLAPSVLVPYIELAKLDRALSIPTSEVLAERAATALARHVRLLPEVNPFERYAHRLPSDLDALRALAPVNGTAHFHAYAFSYFRMFGAAFSLASAHLRWLAESLPPGHPLPPVPLLVAAEQYDLIAQGAKSLQLRTARSAMTGKHFDPSSSVAALGDAWQRAADLLRSAHQR